MIQLLNEHLWRDTPKSKTNHLLEIGSNEGTVCDLAGIVIVNTETLEADGEL